MTTLPPLPEANHVPTGLRLMMQLNYFTTDQMTAYGALCYRAALEEAIVRAAQWGQLGRQFIAEIESMA